MVRRISQEQVVQEFAKRGFVVLEPYAHNKSPLLVRCPEGHEIRTTRDSFVNNGKKPGYNGCLACSRKKHGQARALRTSEVEQILAERGFKLIGDFVQIHSLVEIECPFGHRTKTQIANFRLNKIGCRLCAKCGYLTQEEAAERFAKRGFCLIGDYIRNSEPVLVECPVGHFLEIRLDSFLISKNGCRICTGREVTQEQKESAKLRVSIHGNIRASLKLQSASRIFRVSNFANLKAAEIFEKLGPRPEGYHLDHIIPRSYFDHRKSREIDACWMIYNLRYLPELENIIRSNRLTHDEVLLFSEEQINLLRIASFKPQKFTRY